jgi:acyl-CoA synthetase (AMP-forming)/AMP-acid ligase II/acyl carrier protein
VLAVGGALRRAGVRRGDAVALVTGGEAEAAVAFLGIASHTACAPLNPAYREAELEFFLRDLDARALVVDRGLASPASAVARGLGIPVLEMKRKGESEAGNFCLEGDEEEPGDLAEAEDVALLLHTSGTTSRPKLVPLTHRNLVHSAKNIAATLDLSSSDRCLNPMPLFHIHGLVAGLLAPLVSGGSVACTPGMNPESFLDWLEELEPTWYTAVPTMHHAILDRLERGGAERAREAGLRFARSSSSSLPSLLMKSLEEALEAPVIEAYGMTEASHQITTNPLSPGSRKPGSVGVAGATEIAVVDARGRFLPEGGSGEVVIRGVAVTAGYRAPVEANGEAFLDGWFRTGDRGRIDDDGHLHLEGRIKELINRGGEKIAPREIDEVLLDHPQVAQAVTFAIPHPTLGEEIGAAVVLRAGSDVTEQELSRFSARRLAPHKVPRRFVLVDEIPKGPTGKLRRIGLAETLGLTGSGRDGAATQGTGTRSPGTEAERALAVLWCEVLRVPDVGAEDDFFALGGDSIRAATLLHRVEETWGREIPLEDFADGLTIARMARVLEGTEEPIA